MKRRFVILVNEFATKAQRDAITGYLSKTPIAWWHHYAFVWLIVDEDEYVSDVGWLREQVSRVSGLASCVVLKIEGEGHDWASYLPPALAEWMHDYWSQKP